MSNNDFPNRRLEVFEHDLPVKKHRLVGWLIRFILKLFKH